MAEYIEREAVLSLAKDICVLTKWDSEYRHRSIDPCAVKEIPAADVAPVVRCKKCLHSKENGFICTHPSGLKYAFPNAFCYCGALMDGGSDDGT